MSGISHIATQLHPASSATPMTHSKLWIAITVLSIPVTAVTIPGVTFSILIDATTSEHLICGSNDDYLKTRYSFDSRSSSSIEFWGWEHFMVCENVIVEILSHKCKSLTLSIESSSFSSLDTSLTCRATRWNILDKLHNLWVSSPPISLFETWSCSIPALRLHESWARTHLLAFALHSSLFARVPIVLIFCRFNE